MGHKHGMVWYDNEQELQRGEEGQPSTWTGSLSGLFRRVVSVCQSQFAVIGQVFPPPLVAKVTRLLLQRILNDPVYGVQVRPWNTPFLVLPPLGGGRGHHNRGKAKARPFTLLRDLGSIYGI